MGRFCRRCKCISIHSLHTEGDRCGRTKRKTAIHFNPLPPHGGRQPSSLMMHSTSWHFNPLPPHGGRQIGAGVFRCGCHFNPLPPHGGRQQKHFLGATCGEFQSTPSAWRETGQFRAVPPDGLNFNPLPPHGGRPPDRVVSKKCAVISIHSLRMEGDIVLFSGGFCCRYFNPLPPHGGRPGFALTADVIAVTFQSTPSAWRETAPADGLKMCLNHFNPLPPHGGRQRRHIRHLWRLIYFNPLPPHGGRPDRLDAVAHRIVISIHSLRMEGDLIAHINQSDGLVISIHSLRMEGDLL